METLPENVHPSRKFLPGKDSLAQEFGETFPPQTKELGLGHLAGMLKTYSSSAPALH